MTSDNLSEDELRARFRQLEQRVDELNQQLAQKNERIEELEAQLRQAERPTKLLDYSDNQIPAEVLTEDVERVVDELGHAPTIAEYDDCGTFSPYTIIDRLGGGSWQDALQTLGYEPPSHAGSSISEAALRADLERVIDDLGRPPKWGEYDEHGKYSAVTMARHLGDGAWDDTIRAVNHDPQEHRQIPEPELRADLERVIEALGRPPKEDEYREHGDYVPSTIANRLGDGSWTDAIRTTGHEPITHMGSKIPEAALRTDLERVIDDLGRPPMLEEYDNQGRYAGQTLARRFGDGSWRDAIRALGHEPHGSEPRISEADLLSDLERVANLLGEPPTSTEYREHGEYATATVSRRLGDGSWIDAIQTFENSKSAE